MTMDDTQVTLAEAEFAHVAAQLTTDELTALAERVSEGEIDGHCYFGEGCGCFYGTIGILRGESRFGLYTDGDEYRDTLLGEIVEDVTFSDAGTTPLEDRVYPIYPGQVPATNEAAAWLHGLLQAEIARRDPA